MKKLDRALADMDDWDLLQATFEGMLEEVGFHPGVDIALTLEKEFPDNQSKRQQEIRLKRMLSQRNEWGYAKRSVSNAGTPPEILREALQRILNEMRLSQQKTVRQLLRPFLDTSIKPATAGSLFQERCAWTQHFRRDFWEFLASQKIDGIDWFPALSRGLQPGELRVLEALQRAYPEGLTVPELAPMTRKDALSEDTPRGSLDVWIKGLKAKSLIRSAGSRPKRWYWVKDDES